MASADTHIRAICKLFKACQYRHDLYTLFSDCMEAAAISISNSIDTVHREAREARYMEIVGRYERDVIDTFPKILGEVIMAMEAETCDVLGRVFGELELSNAARGQFFTPYTICKMMAMTMAGPDTDAIIEREGFVMVNEPACGAGAMVIALAEAMMQSDVNYQRHMHVTAIDIDPRAVHMAYIQFSLLHIPAVVVLGNALLFETRAQWFTPAHILGGWGEKLAERAARTTEESPTAVLEAAESTNEPPIIEPTELAPGKAVQLSLF